MASFRIQFPVTCLTTAALANLPSMTAAIGPLQAKRDQRQIIRVLENQHHEHIRSLLAFLEEIGGKWPALLREICSQTSELQFRHKIAELYLLAWLSSKAGMNAAPATAPKGIKHPDVEASWDGQSAKIELYTPTDFVGLQYFEATISQVFKYLDVDCGFKIDVNFRSVEDGDFFYAHQVGSEEEIDCWLSSISAQAHAWIAAMPQIGDQITSRGPNDNVEIVATLLDSTNDPGSRLITRTSSTRSTDSRIFFDMGTPHQVADGPWGKKVLAKMKSAQCGAARSDILRVLVVNFSEMETSFRHFFTWEPMGIKRRLAGAVSILGKSAVGCFDAVVICELDKSVVANPIVILTPDKASMAQDFAVALGLATEK